MTLDYIKDIVVRAAWTGAQAGLAIVVAAGNGWVDVDVWRGAAVVAIASALAALKTAISFPRTPTPVV